MLKCFVQARLTEGTQRVQSEARSCTAHTQLPAQCSRTGEDEDEDEDDNDDDDDDDDDLDDDDEDDNDDDNDDESATAHSQLPAQCSRTGTLHPFRCHIHQ